LQLEPFVTNDGETLHHNGSDEKSPNFFYSSFDLILTKDIFYICFRNTKEKKTVSRVQEGIPADPKRRVLNAVQEGQMYQQIAQLLFIVPSRKSQMTEM